MEQAQARNDAFLMSALFEMVSVVATFLHADQVTREIVPVFLEASEPERVPFKARAAMKCALFRLFDMVPDHPDLAERVRKYIRESYNAMQTMPIPKRKVYVYWQCKVMPRAGLTSRQDVVDCMEPIHDDHMEVACTAIRQYKYYYELEDMLNDDQRQYADLSRMLIDQAEECEVRYLISQLTRIDRDYRHWKRLWMHCPTCCIDIPSIKSNSSW
jgi:hypothetical protein